ncbi:MAG TPA: hypothetical protein VFK79_00870 [Xanthobacteraceae bacterium]|nr:hypothetical protein [Xanthobacteraceae bacterium]
MADYVNGSAAQQRLELMRCRQIGPDFRYGGREEIRAAPIIGASSAQVLIQLLKHCDGIDIVNAFAASSLDSIKVILTPQESRQLV